jgi:hypothetical protein
MPDVHREQREHREHRERPCCDRCPGAAESACAERIARRRLLKSAVFQPQDSIGASQPDPAATAAMAAMAGTTGTTGLAADGSAAELYSGEPGGIEPGFADVGQLPRAVTGAILDVSPQVICVGDERGEQRFALTSDATAWRGGQLDPAALQPGDDAVIRLHPSHRGVADRIWANIGRVTGTIIEHGPDGLVVDEGITRKHQEVVIPRRAAGRIQVRFPTLEPGFLIDVIGIRRGGVLEGMVPATSQPAYRSDGLPPAPLVSGHVPDVISGSATWHEPSGEPHGVLGVAYPAIDPSAGCAEEAAGRSGRGYMRMPYLAIGSILLVHNECTGSSCALPVTGCAAVARLFNDRCVTCGTSPRGRVADLTLASFVALGGELERGCFNATITIGH